MTVSAYDIGFPTALSLCLQGFRISRKDWADQWVSVMPADDEADMTRPYLYQKTNNGDLEPWTPDQVDMFAEDWVVEYE